MPITYKPLWKQLIDRDMTKKDFVALIGISTSTLNRMSKNEYVSLKIIDDICNEFECTPNDVIQHVPPKK